jgi:hypothetical protein
VCHLLPSELHASSRLTSSRLTHYAGCIKTPNGHIFLKIQSIAQKLHQALARPSSFHILTALVLLPRPAVRGEPREAEEGRAHRAHRAAHGGQGRPPRAARGLDTGLPPSLPPSIPSVSLSPSFRPVLPSFPPFSVAPSVRRLLPPRRPPLLLQGRRVRTPSSSCLLMITTPTSPSRTHLLCISSSPSPLADRLHRACPRAARGPDPGTPLPGREVQREIPRSIPLWPDWVHTLSLINFHRKRRFSAWGIGRWAHSEMGPL